MKCIQWSANQKEKDMDSAELWPEDVLNICSKRIFYLKHVCTESKKKKHFISSEYFEWVLLFLRLL